MRHTPCPSRDFPLKCEISDIMKKVKQTTCKHDETYTHKGLLKVKLKANYLQSKSVFSNIICHT